MKKPALLISMFSIMFLISCKKEKGDLVNNGSATSGNGGSNGGVTTVVEGCTDFNSPNFNSSANSDNGTCTYLYITSIEITTYPLQDNGSNWDSWPYANPDVKIQIKESGASTWKYDAVEFEDTQTQPLTWQVSPDFVLTNKSWEWEVVDEDVTFSDVMGSGTFNPFNGNGTFIQSNSSDGLSSIKVYYEVR